MPAHQLTELTWSRFLEPFDEWLARDDRYESLHFTEPLEQSEADGSRFYECAFGGVTFDAGSYSRTQFRHVWFDATRWVGSQAISTDWADAEVNGSLFAGIQMFEAQLRRVAFNGCKLDSVNLRGAKLQDVQFVDCQLKHVDFSGATLSNVTFPGSILEGVTLDRATLKKVDFSVAAQLGLTGGYDSLRGATISTAQVMDLAPAFAQTLGINIRDT